MLIYQLFALLAGAGLIVQATLNGKLRAGLGSPIGAAIISFLVGLLALVVVFAVRRESLPAIKTVLGMPGYYFIGGLLGALYVAAATVLFPKLGALQTTGLVVGGQIVASLLMDHFGLLGVPVQPLGLNRALAAVCIFAAVWLSGR